MKAYVFGVIAGYIAGLFSAAAVYEHSLKQLNRAVKESLADLKVRANDYVYKGRQ